MVREVEFMCGYCGLDGVVVWLMELARGEYDGLDE